MKRTIKMDVNNNTIIITRAFAKKAEIFGTPEFRELMEARKELESYTNAKPTVEIEKKAKKTESLDEPKEKKIRPSYKMMSDFIKSIDDEENTHMEEFDRQRKMVRFGTTKYNATLEWFMYKYSNDDNYKEAFYALKSAVAEKDSDEEPAEENNTIELKKANY